MVFGVCKNMHLVYLFLTHTVKAAASELVVRMCDIVGPVLVICQCYKADLKIRTHTTRVSEKIPE